MSLKFRKKVEDFVCENPEAIPCHARDAAEQAAARRGAARKKFQRRIENFVCGHCSTEVKGDGFTNHCPKCLYGKHLDVYPGDREETCNGMMEPVSVSLSRGKHIITHRCQRCGVERKNKSSKYDNIDVLIEKK